MPTNPPANGREAFHDMALRMRRLRESVDDLSNNRVQLINVFAPKYVMSPSNGQMTIHPQTGQIWYFFHKRWRPLGDMIADSTYEADTAGGTVQVTSAPTYLVSYWLRNTTTTEGLNIDIEDGIGGGDNRGHYTLGKYMGANNLTPKYFPTGIYLTWDAGVEANLEYTLA